VTTLAEVAIKASVGIIAGNTITATLAFYELGFPAVIAIVFTLILVGFIQRDCFPAIFTFYCFHKEIYDWTIDDLRLIDDWVLIDDWGALRHGIVEAPDVVEADEIEYTERAPLVFVEVEIGES